MDKKRLDRIVREEVASLLEALRTRTPDTTGYRGFAGGRDRDDIEGIDRTTGMSKPWSTRGDYPRGGEDEPDDRTPEERRQDRARMRAAQDRAAAEQTAKVDALFDRKTKNVYTRGEGAKRTVVIGPDGSIALPSVERYDFLTNPANSDVAALRDQIDVKLGFGGPRPGRLFGYAQVEMDGGMWKVTGESPELMDAFRRPLVGTGSTVEDAYRDLLGKVKNPDVSASFSSAGTALEPISESRWGQLAGLMVEGKGDSKAGKKFSASTEGLSKEDITHAKKMGLERKGDTLVGTVDQHRKFHKWTNATSPQAAPPFDPDELDAVDEGAPPPGMTGARGSRMPPKPVDPKSGPPGKEDLEKTKKAGPFEGKRRK
jgi:hypothetical protein